MHRIFITIFIFLISKVSFSFFDSSRDLRPKKNADGKCYATLLKENESKMRYIDENSLEWHYCDRMFASSFKKVYDSDFGVPAIENKEDEIFLENISHDIDVQFISMMNKVTIKVSENGVYPFSKKEHKFYGLERDNVLNSDYFARSVDWEILLELNLKAKDLWENSVVDSMEEDSLDKRYEKARELYFKERLPQGLNNQLADYKKEVIAFLTSSDMKMNYGLSLLTNFHPFFTQVLLEQLSIYFFYSGFGVWPTDKSKSYEYDYLLSIALSESGKGWVRSEDLTLIKEHYSREIPSFRKITNNLMLLSMIAPKKCVKLGLRPELSRSLIQKMSFSAHGVRGIGNLINTIIENTKLQCGDVYMNDQNYSANFKLENDDEIEAIVDKFRNLAIDKEIPLVLEGIYGRK